MTSRTLTVTYANKGARSFEIPVVPDFPPADFPPSLVITNAVGRNDSGNHAGPHTEEITLADVVAIQIGPPIE